MSCVLFRRLSIAFLAFGLLAVSVAASGCSAQTPPAPAASEAPAPSPIPTKKTGKRALGPQPCSADYADKPGNIPRGK